MYIVHIMNLKKNISTLKFLFKSENCYFNYLKHYLNSKLIFYNPNISISIQKSIN